MMLAQPTFSGEDFRQQVLGKGRLVKFVRSLKDAYFIFPADNDNEFQQFVGKYFVDRFEDRLRKKRERRGRARRV